MWKPEGPAARAIRQLIVEEPEEWIKMKNSIGKSTLNLAGDSLKRPPQGFDPNHPLIEDIKRKDFLASVELEEKDALAPDFLETTAALCRQAAPLMKFLCRAVNVPY